MRRRRRRRSGGGMSPRLLQIGAGIGAVVLIGGFFYFLNVADRAVPLREEVRVTLPNAFAPEAPAAPNEEPTR